MQTSRGIVTAVVAAILLGMATLVLIFLSPLKSVNWGKVSLQPSQTVTVTGEAKTQQKNQVAQFSAGVNIVNDNKDKAVAEANEKIQTIIDSVKKFGIPQEDIKTQNLSIYQTEETYYDGSTQKSRPGQWRVSNTIDIKLRDIDRSSELADLIAKSGANQVYGPSFSLDDTGDVEKELLAQAIKDSREKAEIMAKSSGKRLGETLSIAEGGSSSPIYPVYASERGGGGAAIEPGTNTVYKSVTVTFELK